MMIWAIWERPVLIGKRPVLMVQGIVKVGLLSIEYDALGSDTNREDKTMISLFLATSIYGV
jgi:hypothetical protein